MTEIFKHSEHRTLEALSALSYRTGELNHYLHEIAVSVGELTGVDWAVITLCRQGLERILASSTDLGDTADQVYSLHGSLTGTVVATGNSLVVEDALTCKDYGEPVEGYRAYLGVPLRTPIGEVIGTICCFHRQIRQFSAEEMRLAQIFAERAATAIDNYKLYQQQQAANQQLQKMNEQLQAEIHERQGVEEALRQSEEQLRQLAENLEQVFWIYSRNGQPIYISPAFEKVWGQALENWYTDPDFWWRVIHPEDRERTYNAYYHGCDRNFDEEYRIIRPDGSVRIIRAQAFPIHDEAGQIYRIAGISEDITERKQAEQDMLKAISSLAEVGELAAMIVHEIRNPLTTVMMGLNSFKRLDLPEFFRERLTLSLEEAERLRNLLSEILVYAKPQTLERSPVELNQFITEILDPIRTMPLVMSRHITFIPAPHAVTLIGDKDKLKQVFINLIDNACEAIAEGETITWTISPDLTTDQVTIGVHNRGNPIPPDLLPRLTKPFYTTKSTGTGLGLAIVKRIVQSHDGELMIMSSSETGTTVSVRLPILSRV